MDETYQTLILLIAVLLLGSVAGIMQFYSHTLMRGLRSTNDKTFVGAFQAIDRAIINPVFMSTFFGALIASGVSALTLFIGLETKSIAGWAIAAFVLYLVTVIITITVNVPLNNEIKEAGDPDKIKDLHSIRKNFFESRWLLWNHVRTLLSTSSFGLMTWCLYLFSKV